MKKRDPADYDETTTGADWDVCAAAIREARRTGKTDAIVAILRAGPMSYTKRLLLSDFLAACQLKKKGPGAPKKLQYDLWADLGRTRPVIMAVQKHIDAGDLVKVAIGKVSDALGPKVDVKNIWKHRPPGK
jgi:hypothetical protein